MAKFEFEELEGLEESPAPAKDDFVDGDAFEAYKEEPKTKKRAVDDGGSYLEGADRHGRASGTGNGAAKKTILKLLPIIVTVLFLGGYLLFKIDLGSGGKKQESLTLEDEKYKALLAEREDMARRLSLKDAQLEADRRDANERLTKLLEEMKTRDARMEAERIAREKALKEEMQRLLDEAMKNRPKDAAKPKEEPKKTEPLRGSGTPTRAFDSLAQTKARKLEEEKRLAATAYQPPIGMQPGIEAAARIPARLDTKLVSLFLENDAWTVATLTEDMPIVDGYYLPAGTRFLGRARADHGARRMFVDVERIQYKTAEMEMKGVMLDKRGASGLITRYIDARNQQMWSSVIPNLLSATARAAQDLTTVKVRNEYGDTWNEKVADRTTKNVLLEGAAKTMDEQASLLAQIGKDKPNLIIVDAPLRVTIQPTELVPLAKLIEHDIAQREPRKKGGSK